MQVANATTAEDYKLLSSFAALRRLLLEQQYADRLEKPLAYWALPNDRRLPLAFLGRPIGELLNTPFDELSATPGIGQKKISSLVKLLHRATKQEPPATPFGMNDLSVEPKKRTEKSHGGVAAGQFDPEIVSESLWQQWTGTAGQYNLQNEKLGRLVPSLQMLPTVIWHSKLGEYMEYSVDEIRHRKTHGEKRVRVVLEVFYLIHNMLSQADSRNHLCVQLLPKFVVPIQQWITSVPQRRNIPTVVEIRQQLAGPLLEQIKIDAGDTVYKLSEGRLGIRTNPRSVRMQSRAMGVTRARVYQLLEECSKVMAVRWPEGRFQLACLPDQLRSQGAKEQDLELLIATSELMFPEKYNPVQENGHS